MFDCLIAYYHASEFDWHYTKNPIHDWFVDFQDETWEDEWLLIERGVYDDEEYFNNLGNEYWRNEPQSYWKPIV